MKKIYKVTFFSGCYTLLKMAAGFIVSKVIAIYAGPSGMAMLGQLQSIIVIINGLVTAPAGNGLVRYTAENHNQSIVSCIPWWRACLCISCALMLCIIPLVIFCADTISYYVFSTNKYAWLIILGCVVLPFSLANTIISSVLNGKEKYKEFISLGMFSVIISTTLIIILIINYGLTGGLIAIVLGSALSGLVMLIYAMTTSWFKIKYWIGKTDKESLKGIFGYTIMALTTAVTAPIALILVRNIIVEESGWNQAGQWQSVWKISEVYLSVITIALSTYVIPKLSLLKNPIVIKKEVAVLMKNILPIVVLMAAGIYFMRDICITLLFTEEFRAARELFLYQLIGDVIKVAAFIYAYPILTQGKTKIYIISEVLFSFGFVILSLIFVKLYGAQGANIGYMINYILYFIFAFTYTNIISIKKEEAIS
ncbi:O-antigen translocase [Limnobaculum parvum]|uniref:O-antigen translocase n=1 Tax=Limnobaculum parvum TaxID=2172103 RepID=A0A2Y9U274_9GAMM|nr:O-antigen translocase [Limnobaculum parvum]AWH89664.1 O-antigen translocase [Limnobaculum parvum]